MCLTFGRASDLIEDFILLFFLSLKLRTFHTNFVVGAKSIQILTSYPINFATIFCAEFSHEFQPRSQSHTNTTNLALWSFLGTHNSRVVPGHSVNFPTDHTAQYIKQYNWLNGNFMWYSFLPVTLYLKIYSYCIAEFNRVTWGL